MLIPLWQDSESRHPWGYLRVIRVENFSTVKPATMFPAQLEPFNARTFICPLNNQKLRECSCIKSALKPHDFCAYCPAARMHLVETTV